MYTLQTIITHFKCLDLRFSYNKTRYKSIVFPDDNVLNLSLKDAMNGMLSPK